MVDTSKRFIGATRNFEGAVGQETIRHGWPRLRGVTTAGYGNYMCHVRVQEIYSYCKNNNNNNNKGK